MKLASFVSWLTCKHNLQLLLPSERIAVCHAVDTVWLKLINSQRANESSSSPDGCLLPALVVAIGVPDVLLSLRAAAFGHSNNNGDKAVQKRLEILLRNSCKPTYNLLRVLLQVHSSRAEQAVTKQEFQDLIECIITGRAAAYTYTHDSPGVHLLLAAASLVVAAVLLTLVALVAPGADAFLGALPILTLAPIIGVLAIAGLDASAQHAARECGQQQRQQAAPSLQSPPPQQQPAPAPPPPLPLQQRGQARHRVRAKSVLSTGPALPVVLDGECDGECDQPVGVTSAAGLQRARSSGAGKLADACFRVAQVASLLHTPAHALAESKVETLYTWLKGGELQQLEEWEVLGAVASGSNDLPRLSPLLERQHKAPPPHRQDAVPQAGSLAPGACAPGPASGAAAPGPPSGEQQQAGELMQAQASATPSGPADGAATAAGAAAGSLSASPASGSRGAGGGAVDRSGRHRAGPPAAVPAAAGGQQQEQQQQEQQQQQQQHDQGLLCLDRNSGLASDDPAVAAVAAATRHGNTACPSSPPQASPSRSEGSIDTRHAGAASGRCSGHGQQQDDARGLAAPLSAPYAISISTAAGATAAPDGSWLPFNVSPKRSAGSASNPFARTAAAAAAAAPIGASSSASQLPVDASLGAAAGAAGGGRECISSDSNACAATAATLAVAGASTDGEVHIDSATGVYRALSEDFAAIQSNVARGVKGAAAAATAPQACDIASAEEVGMCQIRSISKGSASSSGGAGSKAKRLFKQLAAKMGRSSSVGSLISTGSGSYNCSPLSSLNGSGDIRQRPGSGGTAAGAAGSAGNSGPLSPVRAPPGNDDRAAGGFGALTPVKREKSFVAKLKRKLLK